MYPAVTATALTPSLPARISHIDRVLQEDHRVVVGERDAAAPEPGRGPGYCLGMPPLGQRVDLRGDLEMSQFWQNRQPRLHPAVPKDSTADPGQEMV